MDVTGMAENDTELAEILTGRYPGMVRRARSMLRSDMDAEDAVQDAMLSVLEAPHLLETVERAGAWLATLVFRRAVDILRSKKRRREKEAEAALQDLFEESGALDLIEHEEFARTVADGVKDLPEELRSVFVSNALEGMTFKEMSSSSGIPMGTLMARKKRAVDMIRDYVRRKGFPV
jgi:RNA polymerase sigma factor (sigma-70 family)